MLYALLPPLLSCLDQLSQIMKRRSGAGERNLAAASHSYLIAFSGSTRAARRAGM
jgi:hypothetical protein